MHVETVEPLHFQHASPGLRAEALAIVLSHLPSADRPRHSAAWSAAVAREQAELWVGLRGDRLATALLVQVQPGRTAMVLPPRVALGESPQAAHQALTHVARALEQGGVRLAQALLEDGQPSDAEVLAAGGFRHATDLLYLVCTAAAFPKSPPPDLLEYVPYSAERHIHLAQIVEQTYEGSLDCPGLDKVRNIEDVLSGYRATGDFDPARWLIVRCDGAGVGCLLLADHPENNACELVYMGIVPPARGRGWGAALARHAQWMTAHAGRARLTLAVDAANEPAIAAYAAAGFVVWDRRGVFLRVF